MNKQELDLISELSEYEKKSEESIRAIDNGIYFLTGIIAGLLPFAVLIMVLLPRYNNSIVSNIFGLTFVVAYSAVICLMFWNNKAITKLLKKMGSKIFVSGSRARNVVAAGRCEAAP